MSNEFVELPIFANYDMDSVPLGWVKMRREDMKYLLPTMTIAPAFIQQTGEVVNFGLVETSGYCKKVEELYNMKTDVV